MIWTRYFLDTTKKVASGFVEYVVELMNVFILAKGVHEKWSS